MGRICQKCDKTYSCRQSLWNQKKYCKGETKHHSFQSQNQQPSLSEKKPVNPKFSALIDSIVDEEHSPKKKKKTLTMNELFPPRDDLTPKVDVDDDITDTDTDDDFIDNLPSPKQDAEQADLTAIDVDDDNETENDSDDSDNNESYSRIEPVDMTGEDGRDEGEDDEEMSDPVTDPEELLANKIKDTTEYLIRHDKDEIKKLLKKFLDSDENDDVLRLCELVETWIEKQVATEEKIPLDDINRILLKLQESSSIPTFKLIRLEILLKDILENRYRVTKIVNRMDYALSHPNPIEVSDTLKRLRKEKLISDEQYVVLSEDDNLNLDKVISVIKTTKIGRGINFLPRETSDLLAKLKEWAMDFAENGTAAALRFKIMAALDELRFRKVIRKEKYNDILKDMN